MIKDIFQRKFVALCLSLFIIGFFIGYDYSIITTGRFKPVSTQESKKQIKQSAPTDTVREKSKEQSLEEQLQP